MKSVSTQPASSAPVVELKPAATNAVAAKSTNFPYRLSNTTKTLGELSFNGRAILLENALIDSSKPLDLSIPDSLRSHDDPGAYIVQANGAVDDAFRARLQAGGATIVSYIPNNAYLVTADAGISAQMGSSATVIPWEPYYKIKTSLMQTAIDGGVVPPLLLGTFPGKEEVTKAALAKAKVTVVSESPSPFGTELAVENVSSIASVASLPGVAEVEPWIARMAANDLTRVEMGVATNVFTPTNWLNLSGANVLVAVADSWVPTNGVTVFNPDLPNIWWPTNLFPVGIADLEGHATHVGGIIAANGANSPTNVFGSPPGSNFRGKAPQAKLFALPALEPFITDAQLQQSAASTNALISNNSWAYGTSDYNLAAASYDQAVRDSIPGMTGSQSLIYVFAAGNNGQGGDDGEGGAPNTILSPAVAKNVITVGASELPRGITNNVYQCDNCNTNTLTPCTTNQPWLGMTDSSNQVARFSSRGNVGIGVEGEFGRFKPDVVAPGTFVVSTRSMTWDTNAYYNPVTVDDTTFIGDIVPTNDVFNYSVFVPCDAFQLTISATAMHPTNVDLPLYVRPGDFAQVPADFLGSNFVSLPPDRALTPVDTDWYYAVGNPTNVPVQIKTTARVSRTNELGDYFDVLRTNLNDLLIGSNSATPLYRYESGTSMAAPAVSGVLALMEDYFTNGMHYRPSPALMKALLINGARSLNPIYDYLVRTEINYQGWGMPNLTNSIPLGLTNNAPATGVPMLFVDQDVANALATGESRTFVVNVASNALSNPLRVTLVWTDPPGNPAASIKLVNDLDLIVTNLSTPATNRQVFFGNNFTPGNLFTQPWNGDTNNIPRDNVNNVENIYIPALLGTNYSITVVARAVNVNAVTAHTNGVVQDYALVISSSNGEITNALTLASDTLAVTNPYIANLSAVTNQFADSPDITGGLLLNQHVGASSPLQGTNTLSLTNQSSWNTNGQITAGVSNQWHFYVVTNVLNTNANISFTNALFATFLPPDLSQTPTGPTAPNAAMSTRPEADIDLYVARGPGAFGLTNLDPTVVSAAFKSLTRSGEEFVVFSNAQPNEVFYVGVKSEDQQAAEYAFAAFFSKEPFSQMGPNGEEYLHGINVPTLIPDGSPDNPGIARTLAFAVQPIAVRRVVVTNFLEHQNFGDLVGTLTHSQIPVVLNNHTFGNGSTNQELIYEDNDEGDTPGAQHPDGPGSLKDFIGQQGVGLWMLTEIDNSLFNTGRVDNVFIKLDPQSDTNGIVATIPPGRFFYDFIDVPANATNLTVCVNFLPGSTGPVQLYLRYGDQPTANSYDYTKLINSPGDCLTVSRTDLPPLRPGRYYFGVYNPTATPQTVRITWTFGLDPNGASPTPITSTNSIVPLQDDAVTNSSIFITNNQKIVTVNVGVVLDHPRVSDLDLTLIAPTGQRILLFENRGGISATNMGHISVFTNFFGATASGDAHANTNTLTPVPNQGVLIIDYNFFQIADRIDVIYDGVDIFSTTVSGSGTFTVPYGPGSAQSISIVMNQGDNSDPQTQWTYIPRVVSEDFTYLTFTDDTNATQIPIKFAVPPYDAGDTGTNLVVSDFELATNGEYLAPNIITDALGGWSLTTNDVFFLRTNYFAGTNLLSMASNRVSVVTDPTTAAGGSNYLALARGSISRTVTLAPGRQYTLNYVYRGPGIAGWYRGEGDASDSADPETLGNNGSLIGRFNFPVGEVGQAFALTDLGLAFEFAGTNTYVQVRQAPSLDVGRGSGFTVEGWINPTNITFQQPLVEWLAHVPTNNVVNGQSISNFSIVAGPFLNRANGHYYYMLGQTNWSTSELWAKALGGHLAEVDDANEENWIYDTFALFGGTNYTMWIGLTNSSTTGTNLIWSTGVSNIVYTNWAGGQPTNCSGQANYTAILGATNALPGLWMLLDNNGRSCAGVTNKPFGIVEVNDIQTNGVQFWISVTNSMTNGVIPGNGRLYANIFDTNGAPHEIWSAPGLIQSNVYQHVALTYNTNTGIAMLYYNGTNVAATNVGVFVPKTGGDVLIGKDMSRITNNFFWGQMDEMSIYSRFLSPSEILAIYRISASTTNRNIGKFDPSITPAESLAEAQVSFGDSTNLIFGVNQDWQVHGFSLKAVSNSLPIRITGLEPGMLLDSFNLAQKPPGNLYYLPEQPLQALVGSNAFGNWTLEIRDARTGAVSTNAQLVSWQLQFILETNIAPPVIIDPQSTGTNTVPPGQIAYFAVTVPSWANFATNLLISATSPVDLLFNQFSPPGTGNPGDFIFVNNATFGSQTIAANPPTVPPLIRGGTYYLGVRNNGTVPATVVVGVNYDIVTLTNGVPYTSRLDTNDLERPYVFNVSSNGIEATFQLLKQSGNADLVVRKGLPIPNLLSADYGSFGGTNVNEIIYVLTNSAPVPLSAGPWYLDVIKRDASASNTVRYAVLAKELDPPAPTIINLANHVPVTFTAGPGAALTNFFKFSVTNFPLTGFTNLGLRFELYNQTGDGDLIVQTNRLPLSPPFFQTSRLPNNNSEIIFIRTNSALTNLNMDWYLGVPNNETNPITYTILAQVDTNGFPAFPTAEGAGAYTRGGALATNVYHVTTLLDSGPGSLRSAVTQTNGGGTVVFDVAGTINLLAPLVITNSYLTIAGQTAPDGGITVTGAATSVRNAHDVVLRYLRFRPGVTNSLIWTGSFEGGLGNTMYSAGQTFDGGWMVNSGTIDLLTNGPPFNGVPFDGNYYIDINGDGPGRISTNVTTVPGTSYSLGFAYTPNPNGFSPQATVLINGQPLATIVANYTTSFANLNWHNTSYVFTATSPSTTLGFASATAGASGMLLDAVTLSINGVDNALQVTNSSNVIVDHVTTGSSASDLVSVLNSSNVTVQWSVLAESFNKSNNLHGGSEIRYGFGDLTFHHNLYADNRSANPRLGDNVSLDFVNNVIFNGGAFAGLSTNDIADNPGGFTNFLNYSGNYVIAYTNSVLPNVAFWGGGSNTWIFQTNNFIDTNGNNILDGANISWGMFSNRYTAFSHPFAISPTVPDEAFIAYERVLDFAGASMEKRDVLDRGIVQAARLRSANTNVSVSLLSGMVAWWRSEGNYADSLGGNDGAPLGGLGFALGEVGQGFNFVDNTEGMLVNASSSLSVQSLTIEGWINPTDLTTARPIVEYGSDSGNSPVQFWYNYSGTTGTAPGALYALFRQSAASLSLNTSGGLIPANQWSHVAVTFDSATQTGSLYLNGVKLVSNVFIGELTLSTALPVHIGYRSNTSTEAFAGTRHLGGLDEVSIYNRALSPCEILAIYNSGRNGKTPLLTSAVDAVSNPYAYVDIDRDGIPDFWEITLGENATNFSANLDRDGDGYTDLEEYLNWLGAPHGLTVTNTPANIDLYVLAGNTGNLQFGVANGTNGTVYLTNQTDMCGNVLRSNNIAVFTPTNNFGGGAKGGFGSFTFMVTNSDTTAYFGPVTVGMFVSAVPITNVTSTNLLFPSPTNMVMDEMTTNTVVNQASPPNGVTYTLLNPPSWATIDPTTGVITLRPLEPDGPTNVVITTVATDTNVPPNRATNAFTVTVNEINLAPFWPTNIPSQTNYTISALGTLTVTNTASDSDIPVNPLTYVLTVSPPVTGASIDANGIITWTPTIANAPGFYTFTTVVTDTNPPAVNAKSLSATNTFTVMVTVPVPPFAFTQPAQGVTTTSARLNGMATPNGVPSVAWFEWGTDTTYGNQTAPFGVGSSYKVAYTTSTITGLTPNVPYHFRLVVSNAFAVARGFDQILDQAKVVVWGADYVKQAEVPSGLSNVVAIAGAYDHSLALRDSGTVVAWGDNTFTQTNVPAGLNNVLAIAGGQYSSMALRNNGTVAAWGGNILSVTNVPAGLNSVVMIASGTYASLALQSSGNVVAWGANFFGVTNVPANVTNIVEVAGGSYHSLAIRNDGHVIAWGDNSAGQLNVPATATNVVAIAGGNYHSLALRADGTVVAWGDNSSGQTNVPPGLNNVVAVAAGGFHSMALRNDGSVVAWGDNSAGQTSVPLGLTNVVAISSGYFHSLALTPTLLSTNPIILTLTNGAPQTNSILSGQVIFYRVNVPANVDFTTNSLLFSVNGALNMWFTTNTPPSVANANDFLLITNSTASTSVLSSATSPVLVPGTTYFLGVQNTNNFTAAYGVEVDFHFIGSGPSTNTIPISTVTYTNRNGTNGFLLVWYAATNDLFQVQWANGLTSPWNTFTNIVGVHTILSATNGEFEFFDDGSQSGGLGGFRFYRLILLNAPSSGGVTPLTNGVPLNFSTGAGLTNYFSFDITQTNAAVLFELYNLTGNGDLLAQESNLPVTLPYFSSTNPGTNYEQIVIRTNGGLPNLNAISWFLGVPNQSSNPINYTIRAVLQTNGLLISGLPLNESLSRLNGSNVQITLMPTVIGEKYEIQTNGSLTSPNWGVVTDIIASGTSATFTDPNPAGSTSTLFYRVVQMP